MNRLTVAGTTILLGIFTAISVFAVPQPLELNDYLAQVSAASPGVKASVLQIEGTKEASLEGDLSYIPKFSVLGNYTNDKRQVTNAFYLGSVNSNGNYTFAIDQQFSTGTTAKLSYNINNSLTTNLSPAFFPGGSFQFSAAQTELDITQPIWKNGFGVETRATATLAEATALASHFGEKFKLKQTLAGAETAYYRLAISREALSLLNDVLDRAKKILDWSEKRVRDQIADKIDVLQAKAAFLTRQLEVENGKNEERSAALAFNIQRYSTVNDVSETLAPINTQAILEIKIPNRADVTDDIKAAEQNERAVVANNELSKQKAQPDLSLFGSLAYNGVDTYLSNALSNSLTTNHPMYMVGAKFTFPLFFWETSEIRSGRIKQQLSAEALTLETKINTNENWEDLLKKFGEAKGRLQMSDEVVNAQKEKLDYEKYRLKLGRTTTFQVLTYEQDYANSLINRLHIEQEILSIHAQMKTYSID